MFYNSYTSVYMYVYNILLCIFHHTKNGTTIFADYYSYIIIINCIYLRGTLWYEIFSTKQTEEKTNVLIH